MIENYKIIPDTEGMYSVSNMGHIKNNATNFILKPYLTERGYLQVCLPFSSKEKRVTVNIHKLVAKAFVDNPYDKPYVNHINCIKTDNIFTNLEWVTPSENNEHAVKNGLIKSGEDSYLSVLTELQVLEILTALNDGVRNIELARKYNVAFTTIDDIRCNRTWRYLERDPIPGNGAIKKLTGDDIPLIRAMFLKGKTNKDIAVQFGVASATIDQIRKGNTWKNY